MIIVRAPGAAACSWRAHAPEGAISVRGDRMLMLNHPRWALPGAFQRSPLYNEVLCVKVLLTGRVPEVRSGSVLDTPEMIIFSIMLGGRIKDV